MLLKLFDQVLNRFLWHRWMTNSLQTLKLAHDLRVQGAIPASTSLWAVENPLTNSTDRLKSKVSSLCSYILGSELFRARSSTVHEAGHLLAYAWCDIIEGSVMLMQIDAGAEVIITQPPLLWDKFEAWMNRVQQ